MYTKNYNIHNILKVQVKTTGSSLLKGLNFPLSFFETNETVENPEIVLNIGKFTPSNANCFLVDHKYHIKENYIYCEEYGDKAKWKVEIIGFESSPTIINFDMNLKMKYRYLAPDIVPQDLILLPIIEFCLGRKGFLFAHAGGIVKNNSALIFLGRPGSLKTTAIMESSKKKIKILGDDHLIMDLNSKKAYSFQLYPIIFEYITNTYKDENLTFYQSLLVKTKLYNEYASKSEFWQIEPVEIGSLYLFSRRNSNHNQLVVKEIDLDLAKNKIIHNNKAEIYTSTIPQITKRRTFNEYLIAYSFVFPNSKITTYWDELELKLGNMLKNILIYEVEVPSQPGQSLLTEFEKILH